MKFKTAIAAIAVIAMVVVGGAGYWYYTTTPTYALYRLPAAMKDRNLTEFEKYVDIEGVVTSAVDQLMSQATAKMDGEESGWGADLAKGFMELLKPRLVAMLKKGVIDSVEAGRENPLAEAPDTGAAKLKNLFSHDDEHGNQFTGVEYVNKDGAVAQVGLGFDIADMDTHFVLEIRMRDRGGYWQIAAVNNLDKFLACIELVQEQKLAELNRPIRERLNATATVTDIRRQNRTGAWGFEKFIVMSAQVKNAVVRTITNLEGQFLLRASDGSLLKSIPFALAKPLAGNRQCAIKADYDINQFISGEKNLFEMPVDQVRYSVEINSVCLDGTETIAVATALPSR